MWEAIVFVGPACASSYMNVLRDNIETTDCVLTVHSLLGNIIGYYLRF